MKKLIVFSVFTVLVSLLTPASSNAAFPIAHQQTIVTVTKEAATETIVQQAVQTKETPQPAEDSAKGGKSQIVALILAIFLGGLGIHRFYLGYIWQGIVQLLTAGGFGIWWIIDIIRIATGDLQPKDGSYSEKL